MLSLDDALSELYEERKRLQIAAVVSPKPIKSLDDYLARPRNKAKLQIISDFIPKPPCNILDVGCGRAFVSEFLARQRYTVTCADLPEVIDALKRDIPVRYVGCDLEKEFPDGCNTMLAGY